MAGRPSPIDAVIGTRRNEAGEEIPVTVADRIVAALRAGAFLKHAIAASGVAERTVMNWMTQGGQARIRTAGNPDAPGLTHHERRCMTFLQSLEEAEALWALDSNTTHERLARGGLPQVVTTEETDAKGGTRTIVRTTHALPDARVIEWRLKHRFPDLYSDRVEISGPGGGPIELSQEERASALVVLAAQFREQQAPEIVDAEVVGGSAKPKERSVSRASNPGPPAHRKRLPPTGAR